MELADRKAFEETVWQLARPLDKVNVRVLALEPGGPPRLASTPRTDPATKRTMVDVIDPASLPAALGTVRGQTVLVTGRVDGRLLYVQPSSGPERSVLLPDLVKAAEEADVNLIVLRTASTPRQPGGRNWLWQKVEVRGLEQAMQRPSVADFLNALTGSNRRMTVSATPSGRRTMIDIEPAADFPGALQSPAGDLFSGIVSDVTGRVITTGLQASVRSSERQTELDQRLIPGIPSDLQAGYLVLVILGLFGVPISRAWWRRLWPPEAATEYAGRAGYLGGPRRAGGRVPAALPAAHGAGDRPAQPVAAGVGGGDAAGPLVALAHRAAGCDRERAVSAVTWRPGSDRPQPAILRIPRRTRLGAARLERLLRPTQSRYAA